MNHCFLCKHRIVLNKPYFGCKLEDCEYKEDKRRIKKHLKFIEKMNFKNYEQWERIVSRRS